VREGPSAFSLFGDSGKATLRSYLTRLAAAAKDGNVDAVIITFDEPQLGLAQVTDLRAAVESVRKAGKPVWFFVEQPDAAQYMLAISGDQVYLDPGGGVQLVGVNATMIFLKGLLDKIGAQADLIQIGQFKGAAEPFTRTEPSKELKGEITRLVDGLYDQLVSTIASSRKIEADKVKPLIDKGPFAAEEALEAKLVDRVASRQDMLADLEKKLGEKVAIKNNYGLSTGTKLDLSNPFEILKMLVSETPAGTTGSRIALVYIDGTIVSGQSEDGLFGGRSIGSESIRKALDKARVDEGVKAVVVRINSPGGSATASEVIWQALHRVAQVKPVIISVGGMAASGGYYIASAGQTILVEPSSIVGSIGVVGGKVVLGGLFDKIGVSTATVSRGEHAGIFSVTQPFTESERKHIDAMMQKTYKLFLDRVKAGRGDKVDKIDEVAQGRIFLGDAAIKNGLADRVGGLDDAFTLAAGQAKVESYKVEVVPEPKTLFDVIRKMFDGDGDNELAEWQQSVLGSSDPRMQLLGRMLPAELRQVSRQLIMLRQLQSEQMLTAWPVACEVK
jgi:protease-4